MIKNDQERRLWVLNDEYLYNLFKKSKHKTEGAFVRNNREIIDQYRQPIEENETK